MTVNAVGTDSRSVDEVLQWSHQLVEPGLRTAVDTLPPTMRRIAGYHFGWWDADGRWGDPVVNGGKAIRPALALLAAEAMGGDPHAGLPAAVAVELVHNFSLIQDDVIDGDLTRRHRPAVWSVFGNGAAIVAGDALLALALEVLASAQHPAARSASKLLNSAVLALAEGQHRDLTFERRADVELAEWESMARGKSGSLLAGACAIGAVFGGGAVEQVGQLRQFGEHLGVAFQLADDLLGIWGDPAVTGKPVHSDLQRRKKSLPLVVALNSRTAAGVELAGLYHRDQPLTGRELVRAVELIEQVGGRRWCRDRAETLLAEALAQLSHAVPDSRTTTGGGSARAVAELTAVARLAACRDR